MRSRLLFLAAMAALISAVPAVRADVIYETSFATDPAADGWTTTGWQWGVATPSTGCSGTQDPAQDHSPTADNYIYASDLGACYTNSMPVEYLVSPSFNFTGIVGVHLNFWRLLGVESASYDHAGVDLSTDGGSTWSIVWDHTGGSFSDTAWTEFDYALTTADNQPAVNIRFRMGPADTSIVYCGFNLDDFSVYTIDAFCVDLEPLASAAGAGVGDVVVHPFTVVNCGSSADVINLAVSGYTWPTQVTDTSGTPISSISVPAQSTAAIQVRVTVGSEISDNATLTASNTVDATTVQATVTTSQILYFNDFSTDPAADGWTGFASGEWEWGSATASSGCSGNQDPAADHSGTADNNIIGYAIGGCYTDDMSEILLTSPPLDFSELVNVQMSFWRFLGVESSTYDHATIEGSADGSTWELIWTHEGSSLADTAWTNVAYDVSAIADGEPAFQVRFGMGPSDGSVTYCGWNIDDLGFYGSSPSFLEGTVTDINGPIAGAVVSLDGTAYDAETNASGFYHLAAIPGTYDVTASAVGHNAGHATGVVLVPDGTTVRNFVLTFPEIGINPTSFTVSLDYGDIETRNLQISNTGNGPLEWFITYGTADRGSEAWAVDVYPGENLVHFADIDQPGTWDIVAALAGTAFFCGDFLSDDFTQMYVLDNDTDLLSVMDVATGARTVVGPVSPFGGHTWTGLTGTASGEIYASSTDGTSSMLYTIDPDTAVATQIGSITGGTAVIDIAMSPEGDLFATDINNDSLMAIDPDTGAGTIVGPLGVPIIYAQGLDFDDATGVLYMAGYTSSGALYTVDTAIGSATMVGAFPGGAEVDCLSIASAGVTWFSADPELGTTPASGSTNVTVTFDSTQVEGPGTYVGNLIIHSNDGDEDPLVVPLTMSVTGGGNLNGHVYSEGSTPVEGATVTIVELGQSRTTNASGFYEFLNMIPGTYHVTASAAGYAPSTAYPVVIVANQTTTQDFVLGAAEINVTPLTIEQFQLPETQETLADAITISNTGDADLEYTIDVEIIGLDGQRSDDILIAVDIAGNTGYYDPTSAYQTALTNLGFTVADTVSAPDNEVIPFPSPFTANEYGTTVILTSENWWAAPRNFQSQDETALQAYQGTGGNVLVVGQDLLYGAHPSWGAATGWFLNYVGLSSVVQDPAGTSGQTSSNLVGASGTFAEGINFTINGNGAGGPFLANDLYVDDLTPTGDAFVAWSSADGYDVAIANDAGSYKSFFSTGELAAASSTNLEAALDAIMGFLMGGGGPDWLDVAPASGSVPPSGQATLDLTFDTTGLAVGDYLAEIHILSNDSDEPDVEVDVTLHVTTTPPTPTPTPATPTPTPTGSVPTPTPTPPVTLGVTLDMPTFVTIGDDFYITGYLNNPGAPLANVATFFILEVYGEFWFWPSWGHYAPPEFNEIDYELLPIPTGSTPVTVLATFVWPDTGPDTVTGLRFWGAMLNDELNDFRGEYAMVEFGYGP